MLLRSPDSTPRRDVGPRDSPPTNPPPPNSQGESSNGDKDGVGRKTMEEVDRLLAKLEKEGLAIDGNIATIIDDGISRIKVEAAREDTDEVKWKVKIALLSIASVAVGFVMGVDWFENALGKELAKRRRE